jgi:hypothetical protein
VPRLATNPWEPGMVGEVSLRLAFRGVVYDKKKCN